MHPFSIMNNTPYHFILAGLTLLTFLGAVFVQDKKLKPNLLTAMRVLFVLVILSGCYVWLVVPFSWALLVKSLGGLVLIWTMDKLVKEPRSTLYWVLFAAIAAVGLTLAFFFI